MVSEQTNGHQAIDQLYEILHGYPGGRELQMVLFLSNGTRVPMSCEGIRVDINPALWSRVGNLLGPGNLRLLPTAGRFARNPSNVSQRPRDTLDSRP